MQVDRWPTTDNTKHPYVLSIVCVGMYDEKPDVATIVKALQDAQSDIRKMGP